MRLNPLKYKILVADDSISEKQKIADILQNEHFKVERTPASCDVIKLAKSIQPDIIVLSLEENPEESLKVLKHLKENHKTRFIPVIYLASNEEQENFRHILDYDNIDLMPISIHEKALITRIHHQLLLLESLRTIERQNKKLKKEAQAKEIFYSVIAHDLRSPIGTIKMILEAINNQTDKINDENILNLIRMVTETTDEAYALLENLLLWSNSQNGLIKTNSHTFNITEAIQQVLALLENVARTKNIRLHNHVKEIVEGYGDSDMIKTILRNIINNSIKFTWPGGEIHIDCVRQHETIVISVKDNGQGISRENQIKLKEEEKHFSTYGTSREKGSGLGLQLVRNFIKLNQGKIWFESEEGKGTTFYISLPAPPKTT